MMGDIDLSNGILYAAIKDGEYKPLAEIQNFEMTSPSENFMAFGNTFHDGFIESLKSVEKLEFSADVKFEHGYGHHKKKSFKKWLMANGYSRDGADAICWIIAQCGGEVSYDYVRTVTILTGELPILYISSIAFKHITILKT